jgi:[ribosomal protein S5]-alanine N-acetyltransferase
MSAFSDFGRHPGWPARLGPIEVRAGTVVLRGPRLFDAAKWSRLRIRDREYLEQWEPTAVEGWDERNATLSWPAQWSSLRGMARRGTTLPFMIIVNGELAGAITIGNIVRGALRSAWIGYWVASDRAGGGVATAAVALLTDHAFRDAGLHRLEATVRPENAASLRVLTKSGYREEGLFKRYLDVAGQWRDHLCYAITADEVSDGLVRRLVARGEARLP